MRSIINYCIRKRKLFPVQPKDNKITGTERKCGRKKQEKKKKPVFGIYSVKMEFNR